MSGNRSDIRVPVWTAWAFAATTLLGAFLLFQVQPLIGKFILPWFGGAPAVWTTCMLFFQIVLFGGYAYSHLLAVRLTPRSQAVAQCVLLLAALAGLPIAPSDSWKPAGSADPTAHILLLLMAAVGLPYFMLSTTSPLIQSWFGRIYPARATYRLYSLSNAGSLAALLTYPFVFEPAFDLATQSRVWSWCFLIYAVLTGICAATVWRLSRLSVREGVRLRVDELETSDAPSSTLAPLPEADERHSSPIWQQRALWLLLPACASLILLATTNHVCQDVASVPFLWVVPLSLYLLSFIICFDHSRWYVRPVWAVPAVIGIAVALGTDRVFNQIVERYQPGGLSLTFAQQLVLHFGTMFCIAMVCHGELVRLKPGVAACGSRRLTEFYLFISAGGALGGILVSLVAPHVFNSFLEWNLGMLAAYLLATVVLFLAVPRPCFAGTPGRLRMPGLLTSGFAAGGFIAVLLWQVASSPPGPGDPRLIERRRNFYGVVSVWDIAGDDPREHHLSMWHGAILHGRQFVAPERRREPFSYYLPESGVGRAIVELQRRKQNMRVGVVGLGAGALACYARPGDHFTFYEINPAVQQMAEKYFTFLSDARQRGAVIDIVEGDARLRLEGQSPQNFDLLVLDAFSGDSVPVHLLTREAMEIYRRHVPADAVLAINVTNSYLYLFPVVRALADDVPLGWRRVYLPNLEGKVLRNDWIIISGNEALLSAIPNQWPPRGERDDAFQVPAWTDHHNNLFRVLIGRK